MPEPPMPFLSRWKARVRLAYNVLRKRTKIDPIQHTIVNENVLAIMGVCMPIMTSVGAYATGIGGLDLIGEMLNGVVQIYLGALICTENVGFLIGKSMSKADAEVRYS